VEIKEVIDARTRKQFVELPFRIYKGNSCWVPPLKKGETESLMPEHNPAFDFCRAAFWIAIKDGQCVGRIGAIINDRYNKDRNENLGRICRMEFIDEPEVSAALFSTAETWLKAQGVDGLLGPLGFTNLDTQGLLIEGFEHLQSVASVYHLPYYQTHFDRAGYVKEIDWLEFKLTISSIPEKAARLADMIRDRYKLKVIHCYKKEDLVRYSDKVFTTLNKAFSDLPFVVNLDKKMEDYYVKKYFNFLNPKFVKIIETEQGEFAGFIIAVPSLSKAMQKANGSLFPFGFIHLLRALKHPEVADLFLTGVEPHMQGFGVPSLLISELQKALIEANVGFVETTGIFETNQKAITTWKNYDHIQHKRRRCYRKMFS
jgi:GNAT superfamily N-acetyltransferase